MSNLENYVFHLWTSKTGPLRYLSELLRDLLTEGNIECTKEGMRLMSVSSNREVLIHLKLQSSNFEEYSCSEPLNLGLNLEDYFKVIKLVESNETLRYFVDKNDLNTLGIQRFNKEENISNIKYITLMDIQNDNLQIPEIEFKNVIVMNSGRFQKICKEIYGFSNKVQITSSNSILKFAAHCANVKQEIVIKPTNTDNGMKYESNNKEEIVEGIYNIKYLVQFSKCANLSNTVKLYMENDLPLLIECDVAQLGVVRLLLAPQTAE